MKPLSAALVVATAATPLAHAQQFDLVDVTPRVGLEFAHGDGRMGIAIGDYNGDGWQDVAIFGANDQSPAIFRNEGAKISAGISGPWFTEVTDQVMPMNDIPTAVGTFADLDNDGDQDIVCTRRAIDPATLQPIIGSGAIAYYENKLDTTGKFELGTNELRVGFSPSKVSTLTLVDQDGDSDLDIFFAYSGLNGVHDNSRCFFIRNDGLPNLVDASATFGPPLRDIKRCLGAVFADFDGDMLPDLHCAVDFYHDVQCKNMGGGNFVDVSTTVGVTNLGSDMGLAVGDIDGDLDLDIYSTNINTGVLYVNDGTGHFSDEAGTRGVQNFNGALTTIGWGTNFVDLDNDGDLDLTMIPTGPGSGHVWENDGTGHFTKVTAATGINLRGYALIDVDIDKDGDQDLIGMGNGALISPNIFWNTENSGNHWLAVELEGTVSNRDAIGAVVYVRTTDGHTQMRTMMAGHSYRVGAPKVLHFGLGDEATVEEIEIRWPNGGVTRRGPFTADRFIKLRE